MWNIIMGLALAASTVVMASEPGQPLDCSDWIFDDPALRCVELIPPPCNLSFCGRTYGTNGPQPSYALADNSGRLLALETDASSCGGLLPGAVTRTRLTVLDGSTVSIVARLEDRCSDPTIGWVDKLAPATGPSQLFVPMTFDAINGRLIIPMIRQCLGPADNCDYETGFLLIAIEGFAALHEISQSYSPETPGFAYTVPAHPEGLVAADHFDTYWGPLDAPIDFTQAQGLQCNYPQEIPEAGDYVHAPDRLPSPRRGDGYYYVTAVTHQGETRYGRQTMGGELSGRDPSMLPGCVETGAPTGP